MWGETGILRMFGSEIGGQIAWLLPAALILLGRRPLVHPARAAHRPAARRARRLGRLAARHRADLQLHGRHLPRLLHGGAGPRDRRPRRHRRDPALAAPRASYAAAAGHVRAPLAFTTAFGFVLLDRTTDYLPWLKWLVAVVGVAAALLLVGVRHLPRRLALGRGRRGPGRRPRRPPRRTPSPPPRTPHTGSIPTAGPSSGAGCPAAWAACPAAGGMPPAPGTGGTTTGRRPTTGGLLEGSQSSAAITALLQTDADSYTWAAAAIGSNSAAGYQLASERAGDGDRRLQRQRPEPDAGAVPGVRRRRRDPLLHRRRRRVRRAGRRQPGGGTSSEISTWVAADLHRDDRRRRHALRPLQRVSSERPGDRAAARRAAVADLDAPRSTW